MEIGGLFHPRFFSDFSFRPFRHFCRRVSCDRELSTCDWGIPNIVVSAISYKVATMRGQFRD